MEGENDAAMDSVHTFHSFNDLHDDLRQLIVSFVAAAPFEKSGPDSDDFQVSTMTSTFPKVNKQFNSFCCLEEWWKAALSRQLRNQSVWKEGLERILPEAATEAASLSTKEAQDEGDEKPVDALIAEAKAVYPSCKEIYKQIITHHINYSGPMFLMPCGVSIGEAYGLHLFEPRYRIMVHDAINSCQNPDEARNGRKIIPGRRDGILYPPLILHACRGTRIGAGAVACLVEIVWCQTYHDGTADVRLLPVTWVRIEEIWVRPASYDLFYGKASRIY